MKIFDKRQKSTSKYKIQNVTLSRCSRYGYILRKCFNFFLFIVVVLVFLAPNEFIYSNERYESCPTGA